MAIHPLLSVMFRIDDEESPDEVAKLERTIRECVEILKRAGAIEIDAWQPSTGGISWRDARTSDPRMRVG